MKRYNSKYGKMEEGGPLSKSQAASAAASGWMGTANQLNKLNTQYQMTYNSIFNAGKQEGWSEDKLKAELAKATAPIQQQISALQAQMPKKYDKGGPTDGIDPNQGPNLNGSTSVWGMSPNLPLDVQRGVDIMRQQANMKTAGTATMNISGNNPQIDPIVPSNGSGQQKPFGWEPFFAMRNAVGAATELGGRAERSRQDQYYYNQLSSMGQMNPMPASDYQPNPYRMYARYGGSLKKYGNGGGTGGEDPKNVNPTTMHYIRSMASANGDGKFVVTDKANNHVYYGQMGKDGNFSNFRSDEVLTGANRHGNVLSGYSGDEVDPGDNPAIKTGKDTPIGQFTLNYDKDVYGKPGLTFDGSNLTGLTAFHYMYDPANRGKLFNNGNPDDNYRSFGCINCKKPTIDNLTKGFAEHQGQVIDSALPISENDKYTGLNRYLVGLDKTNDSEAIATAKMVEANPNSWQMKRYGWNSKYGMMESPTNYFDSKTDTEYDKQNMEPVVVRASRRGAAPQTVAAPVNTAAPANAAPPMRTPVAAPSGPMLYTHQAPPFPVAQPRANVATAPSASEVAPQGFQPLDHAPIPGTNSDPSIVDFLNRAGKNASYGSRAELAKAAGIKDYKGTADQNVSLLSMMRSGQLKYGRGGSIKNKKKTY